MEYQEYLSQKREIYDAIIQFIENEDSNIQDLIILLEKHKIQENLEESALFFRLIIYISNNHHRSLNFFNKFEEILQFFNEYIKKAFQIHKYSIFSKATNY